MEPSDMVALQDSLTDAVIARLFPETSGNSILHGGYTTGLSQATDPKPLPSGGAYVGPRPDQLRIPLPEVWTTSDDPVLSNESDQSGICDFVNSPTEFPFPPYNNNLYDIRSTDLQSTTNHVQPDPTLGAEVAWCDEPGRGLVRHGSTQGCLPASTVPWSPVTMPALCSAGRQYVCSGDNGEAYMTALVDEVSMVSPGGHYQQLEGSMSPFTGSCSAAQLSDSTLKSGSPPCQKQVKKVDSKKRGHNIVERRYRTNLNEKLERLRERIPTLCVNKGNVLEKAAEYIEELESNLKVNMDENARLRFRIQTLEKIMMMDQGMSSSFINSGNLRERKTSS